MCLNGSIGFGSRSCLVFFFFQAEDGIRDLVRSRGLGDVYKRQDHDLVPWGSRGSRRCGEPGVEFNSSCWGDGIPLLSLIHI